jgi:hypothetical protein
MEGDVSDMVKLHKIDRGDPSCGVLGVAYAADADGTVSVPAEFVAELCDSHGFAIVPDSHPEVDHRRVPRRRA